VDLPPVVPIARAEDTATPISDWLAQEIVPSTCGLTPLTEQLRYYASGHEADVPELYEAAGNSYLVFVSDGADTCEGDSENPDVSAIVAEIGRLTRQIRDTHGIRSFAIGFGDTSGDMAAELNAIAENGGTEFTSFFPINDESALVEALDRIRTSVVSCTYDIDEPDATADPTAVNFYFDGDVVGMDDTCTNGWRWEDDGHGRVQFCGRSCERIRNGEVATIEARFGCSTVIW
jgi:hypothetical protein